jgi:hypothetical protein
MNEKPAEHRHEFARQTALRNAEARRMEVIRTRKA